MGGEGAACLPVPGMGRNRFPCSPNPGLPPPAPGALTPPRSTSDTAEPCSPPGRSRCGWPPPGSWPVTQERTPIPCGHECKNKKLWSTLQMGVGGKKGCLFYSWCFSAINSYQLLCTRCLSVLVNQSTGGVCPFPVIVPLGCKIKTQVFILIGLTWSQAQG